MKAKVIAFTVKPTKQNRLIWRRQKKNLCSKNIYHQLFNDNKIANTSLTADTDQRHYTVLVVKKTLHFTDIPFSPISGSFQSKNYFKKNGGQHFKETLSLMRIRHKNRICIKILQYILTS